MKTKFWLTVDSKGGGLRVTRKQSFVHPNEVCIPIELEIPDEYFKRPQLSAKLVFPEVEQPPLLAETTVRELEQNIFKYTGFSIAMEIIEKEVDKE